MIKYTTFILKFFRNEVIWFNDDENPEVKGFNFYTFRQSKKLVLPKRYIVNESIFTTTFIDLEKEQNEIWDKFSKKSTQYEINKAKKNEQELEVVFSQDRKDIEDFMNVGKEYYMRKYGEKKNISINDVVRKKDFLLCSGFYKGNFICGHLFIFDENRVRLNYSFSRYLEGDNYKVVSGYLAKYLHWKSMLYFKEKGFKIYDFGGITLDENDVTYGITKFKLSFGGEHLTEYDYIVFRYANIIRFILALKFIKFLILKLPFIKKMVYG